MVGEPADLVTELCLLLRRGDRPVRAPARRGVLHVVIDEHTVPRAAAQHACMSKLNGVACALEDIGQL